MRNKDFGVIIRNDLDKRASDIVLAANTLLFTYCNYPACAGVCFSYAWD